MREHRLNATGYSLGTTFAPNWMDWPMFYHGNPVIAAENMVFFLHMILMDSNTNHAMCFGHTVVVTENGSEVLSDRSLELVVR
jgi:Xaa-Pro dipeptidase